MNTNDLMEMHMVITRFSIFDTTSRRAFAVLAMAACIAGTAVVSAQDATPAPTTAAAAPTNTYRVDPVHSFIVFKIKHLNTTYAFGRFNNLEGTVTWDEAKPEASAINVTVQAASVDTGNAQRDTHLKSGDFFKADEHPTLSFTSKSITPKGGDEFELKGDLQMLGVTKELTTTIKKTGQGQNRRGQGLVGGLATFTVKRSDFGMDFMMDGLGDEVEVTVSIEAPAQAEGEGQGQGRRMGQRPEGAEPGERVRNRPAGERPAGAIREGAAERRAQNRATPTPAQ